MTVYKKVIFKLYTNVVTCALIILETSFDSLEISPADFQQYLKYHEYLAIFNDHCLLFIAIGV